MSSSRMSINNLLSSAPNAPAPPTQNQRPATPPTSQRPQGTPTPIRSPNAPEPQVLQYSQEPRSSPTAQATQRGGIKQRKKEAPLLQRAISSPRPPYSRKQTPSLSHTAVLQAQTQAAPSISSGSTIGSSHTVSSTHSTPPAEFRSPMGYGPITAAPPPGPERTSSSEKMDVLADLASLQYPQQGISQAARNLRPPSIHEFPRSPSMPTLSRRSSAMHANADHPMTDAPTATLQPGTFKTSSLDKAELKMVTELTKQLAENTFLYETHTKLIKLLHKGLMTHVCPADDYSDLHNPHDYALLPELRQARAAMDSRFPVGEELWIDWIQDECMLARNTDDRIAVMELCQKAVQDEVGSTRIWRLYGDWVWTLYRTAHDISGAYESNSLEQHPVIGPIFARQRWIEDEKIIAREVLGWDMLVSVWSEAVKATEWRIDESHVVFDSYLEILLHDLETNPSLEKISQISSLWEGRLRQPHATWDNTFQRFSQFVSQYDNANYEAIMVTTNTDAADAKTQQGLRQEFEVRLQRAVELSDSTAEWTAMTEYLEWESGQLQKSRKYAFGFDVFVALLGRANLRFPTDAELWEDHVDFLTEHPLPRYSLLQVARNATRHCPWSGTLWSKRLVILEAEGNAFDEIEDVKHHATSSGLLEGVGGIEELVKVYTAWCGFLRRRAFASDAGEDERDVAEVGIRSELENLKAIIEKKFGKEYKGDAGFRLHRIYTKFLSQAGRYDEVRTLWLQLSATYGDQWEFWEGFYLWEMTIWGRATAEGSKMTVPEHATSALQRAIRQPKLDWPERMTEAYLHHCRQHETALKLQEAQVETRKIQKQVLKRRADEAAEAAKAQVAAFEQYAPIAANPEGEEDEGAGMGKRKRNDSLVAPDEVPAKRSRAGQGAQDVQSFPDTSSSATSQLKRNRENTTVIVKRLPRDTPEIEIRKFFRDCGDILSLQLVQDEESETATATIEFASQEDLLGAQTKSMKSFNGHSIEIQVGTGTTLFVTNYPAEADEAYVRDLFKPYGDIVEVRFPSLKFDTHRRFCYVQFLSSHQAQAATELNGKALKHNLVLIVKISDPLARKGRTGGMEEGREIYVGNVDWKATEAELKESFERFGTIQHVRIPRNIEGRSKGTAFIIFEKKEEAEAALEMNLKDFKGRILNVKPAVSNANGPKRTAKMVINAASPTPEPTSQNGDAMSETHSNTNGSPAPNPTQSGQNGSVDHRVRTLILRNVPDTVNDARIRALAERYGPLRQVKIRPEAGEALVEFVEISDVGKAELGLAGHEITKGVNLEVGPLNTQRPSASSNGLGRSDDNTRNGTKSSRLPFAPPAMRRPGLGMQGNRRGGHGGLGKRVTNRSGNDIMNEKQPDGKAMDTSEAGAETAKAKPKANADFRAFL